MKSSMQAKILRVTAVWGSVSSEDPDYQKYTYAFDAYEFTGGLILVPGDNTSDWFFENRAQIQAQDCDPILSIKEVGEIEIDEPDLIETIKIESAKMRPGE